MGDEDNLRLYEDWVSAAETLGFAVFPDDQVCERSR